MNKPIHTPNAPAAIGPYSQAVQAGSMLFVSGQIPIDPATGNFAGDDIVTQTKQSLTNIRNILEAAGYTTAQGIDVKKLCTDMIAQFSTMSFDGLTGEDMTWSTDGTVSKSPKGMVIKNGAYEGLD